MRLGILQVTQAPGARACSGCTPRRPDRHEEHRPKLLDGGRATCRWYRIDWFPAETLEADHLLDEEADCFPGLTPRLRGRSLRRR